MGPTESGERRRRGIVGPVILIAIGVIFLLSNLGLLGWDAWQAMFRLWPVILIAIGLEILIGRRSTAASILVLAITLGIIGVALYFTPIQSSFFGGSVSTESIDQPLQGATRANVQVSFGAGNVRVGPLLDSGSLIQGTASAEGNQRVTQSFQLSGDTANYRLGTRADGNAPFLAGPIQGGDWDLKLNADVPMELRVKGGVGTANLDLSQLQVTRLDANLGVGKSTITVPASGQVSATINGGVGDVEVAIPPGMAARITANSGLGGVNVPPSYQRQGNTYTSPGYDGSQNRVDLTVKGGVGRVAIQ